jgi:methionyl-tRNA formyltransferase
MRIVFFTGGEFQANETFRYMFAQVAARFPDVHVVAVCPPPTGRRGLRATLQRYTTKIRRLGVLATLEIVTSYPLQIWFAGRDQRDAQTLLRQLPRPAVVLDPARLQFVKTVNGEDAVGTLRALHPDIIIQAGAGILRRQVFTLPRIATLNLHHGIAPLLRGMFSIYWALWEKRPEWLGSTVHCIDSGIDTGQVLAYAPITPKVPGEGYPSLYARATQEGVARLLQVLARLQTGEKWCLEPPAPGSAYRSTISGWRLLMLHCRLACRRRRQSPSYCSSARVEERCNSRQVRTQPPNEAEHGM